MKHIGAPEHTLPTGQYLTHAHNPNTLAVAATDSCFVLISTHQHGTAPGERRFHSPGDMSVRMRKVLSIPRSTVCLSAEIGLICSIIAFFQGLKPEPRRVWSQVYYNHDFPTSKPLLLSRCNICWSIEPTLSKTETFRTGPDSPS